MSTAILLATTKLDLLETPQALALAALSLNRRALIATPSG
jgi:hypothetical protein